ncbi:MAG: LysR family transcriptional regulator [Lachnospiraceae bacterium]|nr:LysR family transcriptional regulator [Lachnospiraceae bacterium]
MDDRKLEALIATIRAGSFNKAATSLHCTQSAVTQAINALENELGCKLLERTHKGISLSSKGNQLLPFIMEADSALSRLKDQAKKLYDNDSLPITVGAFSSISKTWLPDVLVKFKEAYPTISVNIKIGTDRIEEWLASGEIDIGLGDEYRCQSFEWYPLIIDPFLAVLPKNTISQGQTTITQEEFGTHTIIVAPMNVMEKRLQVKIDNRIDVSSDDDSTLLYMVSSGLGVTAMPKLSLSNIPSNVAVLPMTPTPERILGAALPKNPRKETLLFLKFLRNYFKK